MQTSKSIKKIKRGKKGKKDSERLFSLSPKNYIRWKFKKDKIRFEKGNRKIKTRNRKAKKWRTVNRASYLAITDFIAIDRLPVVWRYFPPQFEFIVVRAKDVASEVVSRQDNRFSRPRPLWHRQYFFSSPISQSCIVLCAESELVRHLWSQVFNNVGRACNMIGRLSQVISMINRYRWNMF